MCKKKIQYNISVQTSQKGHAVRSVSYPKLTIIITILKAMRPGMAEDP